MIQVVCADLIHRAQIDRNAPQVTTYSDFFREVTNGQMPYPYQLRLGQEDWPDVLDIPTGLGKTAAVSVAWMWKRGWRRNGERQQADPATPRRLVWCLPMRVLVEQTAEQVKGFLERAGALGESGEGRVCVHLLMGGEGDLRSWAEHPEEDMVLVGTQDMLLSRALMRGWGLSRFQWPIQFALLHNDCLWAFDEVQLMGPALTTSTQLEGLRRAVGVAQPSRSLWLSATLDTDWLASVDFAPPISNLTCATLDDEDRQHARDRIEAIKHLSKAAVSLNKETGAKGNRLYLDAFTEEVVAAHDEGGQTLVIVNRVDRAQELFRRLRKARPGGGDLLLHSRFRPLERREIERRMREEKSVDRIIVATQAVEAGVDLTSSVLLTELAPWSSLVQRFGRCNRYGELNGQGGARVFWIDIDADADPLPYDHDTLSEARSRLEDLEEVGPAALPPLRSSRPLTATLRRKDIFDLFNTDPDLSGFDVDVSDFIRDTGPADTHIFWREFDGDPNAPEVQPPPERRELCRVSIGLAKSLEKSHPWTWDSLDGAWVPLRGGVRPGMTLLLPASAGGYDEVLGFRPKSKTTVTVLGPDTLTAEARRFGGDWRSATPNAVPLPDHLGHVAREADRLCRAVDESAHKDDIVHAARWHDVGKAHPVFQASMHRCPEAPEGLLAKSNCSGPMRHERPYFRHELASALAWLASHEEDDTHATDRDLVAYLIAAHHGKVRMSLRALPDEKGPVGATRFARGIWDGDALPALEFDGEVSKACSLSLDIMELGRGEDGPSWTERTQDLLRRHGVFRLAWMETLVRLADWRASAKEQEDANHE